MFKINDNTNPLILNTQKVQYSCNSYIRTLQEMAKLPLQITPALALPVVHRKEMHIVKKCIYIPELIVCCLQGCSLL